MNFLLNKSTKMTWAYREIFEYRRFFMWMKWTWRWSNCCWRPPENNFDLSQNRFCFSLGCIGSPTINRLANYITTIRNKKERELKRDRERRRDSDQKSQSERESEWENERIIIHNQREELRILPNPRAKKSDSCFKIEKRYKIIENECHSSFENKKELLYTFLVKETDLWKRKILWSWMNQEE